MKIDLNKKEGEGNEDERAGDKKWLI